MILHPSLHSTYIVHTTVNFIMVYVFPVSLGYVSRSATTKVVHYAHIQLLDSAKLIDVFNS